MGKSLSCKALGAVDCGFVGRGESEEELFADVFRHAREVHGYTDRQLSSPGLLAKMRGLLRED